jgi:hypothetical protein
MGNIMLYKDIGDRANIRVTLEYFLRANCEHDHEVGDVIFLQGSSISDNPVDLNEDGTLNDVNLDELVAEFEQQASLYNGSNRDGKFYNHAMISLRINETLTDKHWAEVLKEFQAGIGYEFDNSLFCAGIHKEKDNLHIHIAGCRVDNDGKLISKHNHYEKAQRVRDRICKKYGLTAPENSFDNMSDKASNQHIDYVNRVKQRAGDSLPDGKFSYIDERNAIRKKIKQIFANNKPATITDYVNGLNKLGVNVEAREGKAGECKGISYRLEGSEKSHSGSKVSPTHASWGALINLDRKGLSYKAERDNPALGLTPVVRARVKVTKKQVSRIKKVSLKMTVRRIGRVYYADIPFNSGSSILSEAVIEMVMKILKALFGRRNVEYYTPLELSQSKLESDPKNEKVYDTSDIQECMQAVEADTKFLINDTEDEDEAMAIHLANAA